MSDSQRNRIRELTARQTFLIEENKRLKWLLGNANEKVAEKEAEIEKLQMANDVLRTTISDVY